MCHVGDVTQGSAARQPTFFSAAARSDNRLHAPLQIASFASPSSLPISAVRHMGIRFDQYNTVGVVALEGDLRGDDVAAELRSAVGDALDADARVSAVVIDFTAARFVDSRGLEALLWSRGRLGGAIGAVRLAALDADCRKIVEMTRLDEQFEIHEDVQAALRAMN